MENTIFWQCSHLATPRSNGKYVYDYGTGTRVLYRIDGRIEDIVYNTTNLLTFKKELTFTDLPKWCQNHLLKYDKPNSKVTD